MRRGAALLAICLIPVAVVLILSLAFHERRQRSDRLLIERTAESAERMIAALSRADPRTTAVLAENAALFQMKVEFSERFRQLSDGSTPLAKLLKARLSGNRDVSVEGEAPCEPAADRASEICRTLHILMPERAPLTLTIYSPGKLVAPLPLSHLAGYVAALCVLMSLLTFVVMHTALRPIKQLAQAAADLGADLESADLPEEGPPVVRQAAAAFNAMRARIRRQIQHRTHMLAAITHDLQTPLTRLRLRLEKVADEQLRGKLIDDLAMVQALVKSGLDLARSMEPSEAKHLLDLDSLIESVCADASEAGHDVELTGCSDAFVMAQANALRRCVTNLVDNAIKYGRFARLHIAVEDGMAAVRIRDGGTGIPKDQIETVFDPFVRLEPSRSRETGGTGLGLTIARNIAQNHGGTLQLRNHPEGGAEACLRLPVKRYRHAAGA